jgi:hypothetical protein
MFAHTNPNEAALDENIAKLHRELKTHDPETQEYVMSLEHLTKLYAIKNENRSRRVSPDTMATVIANLVGIGIIVGYERTNIITSKAVGFIKKVF